MRIRRRPPGQPLSYLLPSDPPAAPRPPRDHHPAPAGGKGKEEGQLHLHRAGDGAADLGDARSSSSSSPSVARLPALLPLLPQDGVAECSRGLGGVSGAQQHRQQQLQGPADARARSSLENGHHRHMPESVTIQAGERLTNGGGGGGGGGGSVATVAVTMTRTTGGNSTWQQEAKDAAAGIGGGTKRGPRGPGVLVEGSRCSRKNGRGWRCSQPTLVGYALCQYHLGKGRMRSAAAGGRGPGQLGRTEHGKKTSAATAAPKADVPPPPSVQHC